MPNNKRIAWPSPPPTNEKTGWSPPQNMSQDSKALYNNISNISIAIDPLVVATTYHKDK